MQDIKVGSKLEIEMVNTYITTNSDICLFKDDVYNVEITYAYPNSTSVDANIMELDGKNFTIHFRDFKILNVKNKPKPKPQQVNREQIQLEMEFGFGEHYHKDGKEFVAKPYMVTLCGHIGGIVDNHDAYVVFLPQHNVSVQICEDCFMKSSVYAVGSDQNWENKIMAKYNHFDITDHNYIWFGTMAQFQIHLEIINKSKA